jgi:hypothetical protein
MTSVDILRRLLMESPAQAYCDICLATAGGATLTEIRGVTRLLLTQPEVAVAAMCGHCRRTVPAIAYRPKCVRCSLPIGRKDVLVDGDAFHVHCLRRLIADETIQTTHRLNERSRELIEASRRRIQDGHGWPSP